MSAAVHGSGSVIVTQPDPRRRSPPSELTLRAAARNTRRCRLRTMSSSRTFGSTVKVPPRAQACIPKPRSPGTVRPEASMRMRAKVVEAEAEVPLALAEALRNGNIGVMDYYKMKNIIADTEMRSSISEFPADRSEPE